MTRVQIPTLALKSPFSFAKRKRSFKPQKENPKKKIGLLPWLFLSLSLVGNGVLVYLLNSEKQTVIQKEEIIKTVYLERDNVKNDLLQLKTDYENLQTNDKRLQAEIDEKKLQKTLDNSESELLFVGSDVGT